MRWLSSLSIASVLALACGDTTVQDGTGGTSAGTATGEGGSPSGTSTGEGGSPSGTSSGTATGQGGCGGGCYDYECDIDEDCGLDEVCLSVFPNCDDLLGGSICEPIPEPGDCETLPVEAVCGCNDDVTYDNGCYALLAGTKYSYGACE